jgi:hypothetical protein
VLGLNPFLGPIIKEIFQTFMGERLNQARIVTLSVTFVKALFTLAPLHFRAFFGDESLDWARGRRRDLRKHRLGILLSRRNPKGFRKERRKAYGPASSLERPAPCGFAKRGAVPAPLPGLRSARSPYVSVKVKGGEDFFFLTTLGIHNIYISVAHASQKRTT